MIFSALVPALFLMGASPTEAKLPDIQSPPVIQIGQTFWSEHQIGNDWYIRKGNSRIKMPDEKTARKTAKKFNKNEKKDKKKKEEDGVYNDGSRECNEPTATTLC